MGTGKKEATRRERQGKTGDGMSNVRTKGENFYRSAKKVKTLNMFKEGKAERNASGEITKAASFQGREKPKARVEPHRKWFTNTRVISQDALSAFRGAVEAQSKDPYSYLLKQNKLPMSLINDGKEKERKDGLLQHKAKIRIETEAFGDTFGPKAQRKRPRLAVSSLEDMAAATGIDMVQFQERQVEAAYLSGAPQLTTDDQQLQQEMPGEHVVGEDGELTTAREPVFSKGQSKRIWNELYKVIDSSDVVIHVLDARDPLGTRCRSVEKYIRDEAPHKHLLFILNKCDLVPTSVAAKWVKLLSQEYPTLAFHASLTNSFGKGTLISLLRQFSSLHSNRKQISVGFIGYPNTGKSSIINTLRKKKVCKTAPIPGETKVWQYITLMKRIYLIDCPGIVPPSMTDSPEDILLRGVVRVENVENPAQYIPAVIAKCRRHHLERTYDIKGWAGVVLEDDAKEAEEAEKEQMVGGPKSDKVRTREAIRFLEALARKGGRLLRGGEADMDGVAKMVLNDFLRGKIPWFSAPPVTGGEEDGKAGEDGKGRDEKLGITHKRKREIGDEGREEESGVAEMQAINEEANGLGEGADEVGEDEDDDDESGDDFAGFEEEGSEDDAGGIGILEVEGETDDDSE
ncbi:GTPase required for pre-60S ribosomal subunit nuclear export and maturation [Friedmanniomyces endolithicus]|uniref:Nucleolar GTP-binding protein 2 n=1 Tax=Friedmanniomyces endolithicus TaxID=329885 RepID=A0AAN6QZ58_9PEZI|nr:GTPase required for pre-60S ribosomal subunit nuclear export and maturation [Friedmanniomyces endolithicus]KAK0281598.1 GTPase required for pre-60S ribosomal subunit nuclear export and maturation [Friedmanniomyces endolithicus]KAK0308671.1 GTPase required for pre-60S ribosomal subunit nuclear export and maturation [Friedmanniomyces endolithicus]KAK0315451.1 GTPase required for pre-60S ribosomal subunit nuclear export and maturation [Friedmanniomyces endolithicus]KAK0827055.1 GTPase required 